MAVLEVLLLVFGLGIYSVVFANIIFAFTMCLLNGRVIAKHAGYRQKYKKTFLLPAVCAAIMGGATWIVYKGIEMLLPASLLKGRAGMCLVVLPSVAVAVAVYAVLLVKLHAIDEEELKSMPGGRRLTVLLKRVHVL